MSTNVRDAANIADRDQILAILRESPQGLTASQVGREMSYVRLLPCNPGRRNGCAARWRSRSGEHAEHLGDGIDAWTRRGVLGWSVLPHLFVLRDAGLVVRTTVGRRAVWLRAADGPVGAGGCGRAGS